ncbi:hypothetical protein SDC9_67679 [bioreactor metagenome]|uniref:Uncharacterized protein n=1 Tax=bioreactor metagenome TaxID=1076179 RepID=A0A644XYF0_9ZZZZ
MGGTVSHHRDPRVVGNVQPLVGVRGPGIGEFNAVRMSSEGRQHPSPEAESPVHVNPCTLRPGGRDDPGAGIEGTGVHVAGLKAENHRAGGRSQGVLRFVRDHPALPVGGDGHHVSRAEPEHSQGDQERRMGLLAGDDGHPGSSLEAVLLHVMAGAPEDLVPCGGEAGEVGHLAPGDEADGGFRRQAEEVEDPFRDDLLRSACGGRGDGEDGVLVPGGGKPVGGEARRKGSPGDEAEIPRPRRTGEAGGGAFRKGGHHVRGGHSLVVQRSAEGLPELLSGRPGADPSGRKVFKPADRPLRRFPQQRTVAERRPRQAVPGRVLCGGIRPAHSVRASPGRKGSPE